MPAPRHYGSPIASPNSATRCRRRRLKPRSITPRGGDGVQPDIAEHMRHEARRLEYFRERRIADAETTGIGAERRHHGALAVAGEASPLHRTPARRHPRFGMQMSGDFA